MLVLDHQGVLSFFHGMRKHNDVVQHGDSSSEPSEAHHSSWRLHVVGTDTSWVSPKRLDPNGCTANTATSASRSENSSWIMQPVNPTLFKYGVEYICMWSIRHARSSTNVKYVSLLHSQSQVEWFSGRIIFIGIIVTELIKCHQPGVDRSFFWEGWFASLQRWVLGPRGRSRPQQHIHRTWRVEANAAECSMSLDDHLKTKVSRGRKGCRRSAHG